MSQVINAFHPDYVKTYHPELLSTIRSEAIQAQNGRINGPKAKNHRQSAELAEVKPLNKFPTTKKAGIKKFSLERTPIFTYSKAGTK